VVSIPITAVVGIAEVYGAKVLVKALGGSDEVAGVSGELVKRLTASESRIEDRLRGIEEALDELLAKPYGDALRKGLRYFLDASREGPSSDRKRDLKDARKAFIEASSAAQSHLQKALAERYVLLIEFAEGKKERTQTSLEQMECAATAAAFDAMERSEHKAGKRRRAHGVPRQEAALESMGICGRLLGEAAVLAPELGLPSRGPPPGQVGPSYDLELSPPGPAAPPYWVFEVRPYEGFRIGCLTLTLSLSSYILPGITGSMAMQSLPSGQRPPSEPVDHFAFLSVSPTLDRPIVMSSLYDRRNLVWVAEGEDKAILKLPRRVSPTRIDLRLDPPFAERPFICVTCQQPPP
jgi:hypothetical protein